VATILSDAGTSVNDGASIAVSRVSLSSNLANVTTATPHSLLVGQSVTMAGLSSANSFFDGTYQITSVTSTSFTYALAHADVAPTADSGTADVKAFNIKLRGDIFDLGYSSFTYAWSASQTATAAHPGTPNITLIQQTGTSPTFSFVGDPSSTYMVTLTVTDEDNVSTPR
jgi:hypothetical protein